jgi:hypothetical protein
MPVDLVRAEFGTDLMVVSPVGGFAEIGEILTVITRPAPGWVTMINATGARCHVATSTHSTQFETIEGK